MSKERRNLSQRKIRRIQTTTDEASPETISSTGSSFIEVLSGLSPNSKLYYSKVVFGAIWGLIAGISFLVFEIPPDLWFVFPVIGLISCISFVRFYLQIPGDEVDFKRLWLSGTFTFVILFIVVSSLIWMLPGSRL